MENRKSIKHSKYATHAIVLVVWMVFGFASCRGNVEEQVSFSNVRNFPSSTAVNINSASAEELQKIPHIGEKIAAQIIEHRERYGPFRRAEDLILIPGISDSRFRKIRSLVRVD